MSKIDEVKEILNTLRIALSLTIGVIVVLLGNIINRYDSNNIDEIFWLGTIACFVLIFFVGILVNKISNKTKEIKDL